MPARVAKVTVKVNWVFLERTQILIGIQVTRHFIEFIVVETKQFVGSNFNVILTRQTCGQRSSRAAAGKRRALEKYFYGWIYCKFFISKCKGNQDLGLCTFWVLAKRELLHSGDFWTKNGVRPQEKWEFGESPMKSQVSMRSDVGHNKRRGF